MRQGLKSTLMLSQKLSEIGLNFVDTEINNSVSTYRSGNWRRV